MDFLDPRKQRSYNIRLFVGFVLIAIAIILATVILALITAGYTINRKTGQVIQNSLVYINSQPVSSSIYINNSASGATNARFDLRAGNYNFQLRKSGYHTWSNTVALYGGQVEQLNYPFLFPTNPVKTTVSSISSQPAIATTSPSRQWLLVSVPTQASGFSLINMNNTKAAITNISVPAADLATTTGTNTLSVMEWSTDNQHVLLKDTYTGGDQYIMFDISDPTQSFNVNKLFSTTTFTTIKLDNETYNKLYLFNQASGALTLGDVGAKTVTPILNGVLSFWPYGTNQILYATADSKDATKVDANLWNSNGNNFTLRTLPVGTSYQLNMASYSGNLYAVVGSSSTKYGYVYKNPKPVNSDSKDMPLPFTLLVLTGDPENVTFSTSARFIALQSGSQFAIYDIMNDTHYRYDTSLNFAPGQLATWMDGNRLTAVINGKLTIWDFDGTNRVSFVNTDASYLPAFNQGYTAVYSLNSPTTADTNQWQVTRNSLIADKP